MHTQKGIMNGILILIQTTFICLKLDIQVSFIVKSQFMSPMTMVNSAKQQDTTNHSIVVFLHYITSSNKCSEQLLKLKSDDNP